jgi:hypothetical protein
MILLRAVFTGEHGSMGYFRGSEYTLRLEKNTIYPLRSGTEARPCPYTVEGFLANWKIVEILK